MKHTAERIKAGLYSYRGYWVKRSCYITGAQWSVRKGAQLYCRVDTLREAREAINEMLETQP